MSQHQHSWAASYEHAGTTYRECSDPACRSHQQWICALDRWSEAFATPAPRRRRAEREEERGAQPARS